MIQRFYFWVFIPQKWKTTSKHRCTPTFIEAIFTTAKAWKKAKCPSIDKWLNKERHTYTQWNITQPLEEKEILPFEATWIDLKGIMLSEMSEKDKYHVISHVNLKSKTKEQTKENENRLRYRKQMDGLLDGRGVQGWVKQVKGIKRYRRK